MKIIGIGGLPRSGKDTLADFLIQKGYYGVSLGDIVRSASRSRHAKTPDPISVANMTETSNWLRQEKGADFALKQALEQFDQAQKSTKYKGLVVYSVRAPAEVDFILSHGGQLVWVETTDQVRYQRAMDHQRDGEQHISFEEFTKQEALQWRPQPGIPAESQMNIAYVKSKATITMNNSGDNVQAFESQAQNILDL